MRLIDADALRAWLKTIPLKDLSDGLGLCRVIMEDDFKRAIKNMPNGCIVDAEPVVHGHWVNPHWRNANYCCDCSECHAEAMHEKFRWHEKGIYPICPCCGAKMDEEG